MWIKKFQIASKALWQDASYKRFAFALVFSLLLHLILIGKLNFNLPSFNDNHHVIEVRLELPKSVVIAKKVVVPTQTLPQTIPQEQLPEPVVEHAPELPPEAKPEVIEPATVAPTTINANAVAETSPPAIADAPTLVVPATEKVEIRLNHNAYKYVETAFDLRTDIASSVDSNPAGQVKIVYHLLPNREQYQLKSEIQAKDLASLDIADLQTSEGYLSNIGLQPTHYLYQSSSHKSKTLSADFDWESRKLSLHNAQGEQKLDMVDGTQDLLSGMYQFMLIPPVQNMRFNLTNGEQLGVYDYSFEGEEIVLTKMGSLNTMHLIRKVAEGEEKTELWLAIDYQLVPVKIRKTAKDGKVYELLVTSINTEQPANLQ